MINIFFYQTAIFLFLYFFGKKITENIQKILKTPIVSSSIYINFLFSLFILTLFPIFINFFVALNLKIIIALFIILIFFTFFNIKFNNLDLTNIKILIFTSFLFLPFIINTEIGNDAGLYHLPFQTWIKNYKITFGLSNLHSRYALTTGYDYLFSIFWFKNYFSVAPIVQSSFLLLFFSFFLKFLNDKKNSLIIILILPVLILFPVWQKYVIFDYGSVDFSFGVISILFILQTLYFFNGNYNKQNIVSEILILFTLFTFVVISKPTGILFFIIIFLIITFVIKQNLSKIIFRNNLKFVLLFLFFTILIWFLRNFIISGCLVYPISLTCINVSWFNSADLTRDISLISKYTEHFSTIVNYLLENLFSFKYFLTFFLSILLILLWLFSKKNFLKINEIFILISTLVIISLIDFKSLRGFSSISSLAMGSEEYFKRDALIFKEFLTLILSFVFSTLLSLSILKKYNNNNTNLNLNYFNLTNFFFITVCFILWLAKSPDPRLGFWIFALIPTVFLFSFVKMNSNNINLNLKSILILIILLNCIFSFVFNTYEINKYKKLNSIINYSKLIENNSNIKKRENFGFKPTPIINEWGTISDFTWNYCWNVKDCYYNENDFSLKQLNFKYYLITTESN